jgi:hypothetical protein
LDSRFDVIVLTKVVLERARRPQSIRAELSA